MQISLQSDVWLQSYEGFDNAKDNIKQRNLNTVFWQYLKYNMADIRLIPLDHVTLMSLVNPCHIKKGTLKYHQGICDASQQKVPSAARLILRHWARYLVKYKEEKDGVFKQNK